MIKEILKRWAKPFEHHNIILAFCSEPANRWDAKFTHKALVHLVFMLKLRLLCIYGLELDTNSTVDNTYDGLKQVRNGEAMLYIKSPSTNLLFQPVLSSYLMTPKSCKLQSSGPFLGDILE